MKQRRGSHQSDTQNTRAQSPASSAEVLPASDPIGEVAPIPSFLEALFAEQGANVRGVQMQADPDIRGGEAIPGDGTIKVEPRVLADPARYSGLIGHELAHVSGFGEAVAERAAVGLSLIHISEPTRPY